MTPLARVTNPFGRFAAPLGRLKVNRAWLAYAGYSAFFLVCFAVFALVGFPYDRLRTFLQQEITRVLPPPTPGGAPTRLSIGDMGPTWTLGIGLADVVIEQDPPQPGRMPVAITLDKVTIHPSFLSFLWGRAKVGFDASVGEGSIDGTFATSGPEWNVDAELDEVDLAKLGLGGVLGMPMAGSVSGNVELTSTEEPTASEGALELHGEGLVLGDGKAKVPVPGMGQGLTVEAIKAGKLEAKVAIHQGIAAIEKFEMTGEDIVFHAGGSVRLGRPFERSRVDVTIDAKFTDAYKNRNDHTRAAFQLLEGNPLLKRATSADGTMRFALSGTPHALHSRAAGSTAPALRPARRTLKSKAPQ